MRALLLAAAIAGVAGACSSSSSSSDCTCSVEVNGDKKEMSCGQQACVAGFSYTCAEGNASRGGDACGSTSSSSSSSGSTSSGSTSSGSTSSGSTSSSGSGAHSCADLATFCSQKCKSNDTVYADCTKTASEGNETKCVLWQSNNGSLCR